jgi:di/tricarboxylate transporter
MMNVADLAPDSWPEAVATIIITVISWWLGRKRGETKERKRYRGR